MRSYSNLQVTYRDRESGEKRSFEWKFRNTREYDKNQNKKAGFRLKRVTQSQEGNSDMTKLNQPSMWLPFFRAVFSSVKLSKYLL